MLRKFTKKRMLLVGVAVLVAASAAFAYWTAGGSGSGSAGTQSATTDVTISHPAITGLYPGASQNLSGTFTNSNNSSVQLAGITVSITGVTGPNIDASHPCSASDFTITQPTGPFTVPTGSNGTWSGGSIGMKNDSSNNQDGCKGASVALAFSGS